MKVFIYVLSFLQIAVFTGLWIYYIRDPLYKCPCKRYDQAFPIAKSSGFVINMNLFLTFISASHIWRRFVYISSYTFKNIHLTNFVWLVIFSSIHITAHTINFMKFSSFINGASITGIILGITIVSTGFLHKMIRYNYNYYIRMHICLAVILCSILSIHGSFCSIRYTQELCPKPTSWIWVLCGGIIYLGNFVYKKVYITEYKVIDDTLLYINLDLSKDYVGKTIWILVPNISIWEWHPFTVVNGTSDKKYLYIKARGDWTKRLIDFFRNDDNISSIFVNGPYKTLPDSFNMTLYSEYTALITSGTGITTFVDVMKNCECFRKICFIVIVKKASELFIVNNLLKNIHVQFIVYITNGMQNTTKPNKSNVVYHIGRPDFKDIFDVILLRTLFNECNKINVFFSGSDSVYKTLYKESLQYDIFKMKKVC